MEPLAPARLNVEPMELVTCSPQLAKDVDYARSIQTAWKEELQSDVESESMPLSYQDASGATCYGHVIRTKGLSGSASNNVPGVLFFHTGAGPHDVCLHWKADSLVTNKELFPNGCVVLIVDILSDETGWGWSSDRTKYNTAREDVLGGDRSNLRVKLDAALKELRSMDNVDNSRLAAMGWCLGGYCVLEMAQMNVEGLKAMVTFHGVFSEVSAPKADISPTKAECNILLCHGAEDPFVGKDALNKAIETMQKHGNDVTLLQLKGAKHGFTNPAQDFNPNESFRFNKKGAESAWSSAVELLKSVM